MLINQLMEAAMKRQDIPSLNALARAIGHAGNGPVNWRKGKSYPKETSIVRLCHLADEDPAIWLLRVRIEQAEPEAKVVFESLLKRLTKEKTAA